MFMRYLTILIAIFFVGGCASTSKSTATSNIQIKVAKLERKIEQRDAQMEDLQYDMQQLSAQVRELEEYQMNEPIEEPDGAIKRKSSSPAFGRSSKDIVRVSANVNQIQTALKNAGYYNGNIDGKLGSQSKRAIREFQKDHDLADDGIIGAKTWSELKNYLE